MKFYKIYETSTGFDVELHNGNDIITLEICEALDDLIFILDMNGFIDKSEEEEW